MVAMIAPAAAYADPGSGHPAPDTPLTNEQLFPHGQVHWARCWRLEHDYYALRDEIAHTGVVWRRQQLELRWEEVRDRRREACLLGW
jgi:hypothetical protein